LGDNAGMATCYMNMGVVARQRGEYDEAMELFRGGLAICEELGDNVGIAGCYIGMGEVARKRRQYHEAVKLYRFEVKRYKWVVETTNFRLN